MRGNGVRGGVGFGGIVDCFSYVVCMRVSVFQQKLWHTVLGREWPFLQNPRVSDRVFRRPVVPFFSLFCINDFAFECVFSILSGYPEVGGTRMISD